MKNFWLAAILMGFASSVFAQSMPIDPESAVQIAEKSCTASYNNFAKQNPNHKKISSADKKELINSCLSQVRTGVANCFSRFNGQVAQQTQRKDQSGINKQTIESQYRPQLQACLSSTVMRSREQIQRLGDLHAAGKKSEAKQLSKRGHSEVGPATVYGSPSRE